VYDTILGYSLQQAASLIGVMRCAVVELSVTRRVEALRLLVALLPLSNRDTLWALLTFLNVVTLHSTDSLDQHGNTVRIQPTARFSFPSQRSFQINQIKCALTPSIKHQASRGTNHLGLQKLR